MLRRAQNVKNAGEYERESLREDAERLENICAWLVFIGIGVEAGIVLASFWSLLSSLQEKIAYFVADAAIGLGVYGEMRFGHVAGTVLRLNLGDALREVKYLRSSRRAVLAGNETKFVAAISPFAGTNFDVGVPPPGFREAWDFNWDLEPLLIQAGWIFTDWAEPSGVSQMKRNNWTPAPALRGYGLVNALNVTIELHPHHRAGLLTAAEALADALNDIGITANVEEHVIAATSVNTFAMHILFGMKT